MAYVDINALTLVENQGYCKYFYNKVLRSSGHFLCLIASVDHFPLTFQLRSTS